VTAAELPADLAARFTIDRASPDDAEAVFGLLAAHEQKVLGHVDSTLEDTRQELCAQASGGTRFQRVVWGARPDRLVGWWWTDPRPGSASLRSDVHVHPDLDASDADAIARWGWSQVRRWARQRYQHWCGEPPYLDTASLHGDPDTEHRLIAAGFERVRTFWRMTGRVADEPATTRAPAEVVVRGVNYADDVNTRTVYRIREASFADHWGKQPETYETFMSRWQASAGFDPSLWFIAELDARPVGILLASRRKAVEQTLFVNTLGTLTEARRRGVGSALLHHAFEVARAEGCSELSLGVDSDNPTGAPALYRRAGLEATFAAYTWRSALR
jgi:mycothiol synthase